MRLLLRRATAVPALMLALALMAIAAITIVHERSDAARDAELTLANIKNELGALQSAPFRASTATGGSPEQAERLMRSGKQGILKPLYELGKDDPPAELRAVRKPLHENFAALDAIYELGASGQGYDERADRLATVSTKPRFAATALLDAARDEYARRAASAQMQAVGGTAVVILLLVGAFTLLYRRAAHARWRAESSEERFRTLVTHIPATVYRRAPGGTWPMEFASERIEEIIGDAPAYGPLVAGRAALDEQVAASGEDGFTLEYEVAHRDGRTRWVRDMGQAIRGTDGAILWVDGTISDITSVKLMEADLRVAQRLEAVGQLAAGIAHEINTPMQFVGDSVSFLGPRSTSSSASATSTRRPAGTTTAALERIRHAEDEADLEYLKERVPAAFDRAREGIGRVRRSSRR